MGQPTIIYCDYGTTATATASITGNGNGSDVLIQTEDTFYAPLVTTTFSLVIDLGAAAAMDSFAMLGHNLGGASVEVRGSTDNFAASDDLVSADAVMVSDVNSTWAAFTEATYQYWKFIFSGHPSNVRVAHICLMSQVLLPYFEIDPDIDTVTPTTVQLISQAGTYNGANQQRAMREMSLNWGEVTASELVGVKAFSNACIKVVNPFFFIPDVDETESFYGWVPGGGKFASPQTPGVFTIPAIQFTTRAA
jgi:hypothetical protein